MPADCWSGAISTAVTADILPAVIRTRYSCPAPRREVLAAAFLVPWRSIDDWQVAEEPP